MRGQEVYLAFTRNSTLTVHEILDGGAPAAVAGAYTPLADVPAQVLGAAAALFEFQEAEY